MICEELAELEVVSVERPRGTAALPRGICSFSVATQLLASASRQTMSVVCSCTSRIVKSAETLGGRSRAEISDRTVSSQTQHPSLGMYSLLFPFQCWYVLLDCRRQFVVGLPASWWASHKYCRQMLQSVTQRRKKRLVPHVQDHWCTIGPTIGRPRNYLLLATHGPPASTEHLALSDRDPNCCQMYNQPGSTGCESPATTESLNRFVEPKTTARQRALASSAEHTVLHTVLHTAIQSGMFSC